MCICLGKVVARYVLVAINLIFFVIGGALAVVGGVALYNLKSSPQVAVDNLRLAVILAIVLGCAIAAVSAFGWCGACSNNKRLLYGYSVIVLILVGLQIYALVTLKNDDKLDLKNMVIDSLEAAFNDSAQRESFHALEVTLSCCGTTGPESYVGIYDQLPPSCCLNATSLPDYNQPIVVDKNLLKLSCYVDEANPGCNEILIDFLTNITKYVGLAFIIGIAVELLAIVMAMSLSCCIATTKTV